MGTCFSSSRKVNSSLGAKTSSLATSQTISSSAPSASTCSTNGGTHPLPRTEEEILSTPNLKPFAFTDLKTATRNFRPDSLVGEGGFGYVYKGWIDEQTFAPARPDSGLMVAVKKLKPEGSQGHKEWLAEVNYLGQLRHPQLVRLIGYCLEGDNRLLVYEFMPRGSLENHLFGNREPLPWATRIVVATGAARGLSFLHESKIIYRDVKSANILLDTDFNAKLSDFGLAKDGPTGDKTHISTLIMGTHGYAAPEYIATGRLSTRADVYSFGVVLLELLTGRKAFSKAKPGGAPQNLVEWVKPHLGDKRKLHEIMDLRLEGKYLRKEAQELAALAFQCIGSNPKLRPPMSDVVATLERMRDSKKRPRLASVDADGKRGVS